jgi:RNA polymerase sigma factor (sigma-70 family)
MIDARTLMEIWARQARYLVRARELLAAWGDADIEIVADNVRVSVESCFATKPDQPFETEQHFHWYVSSAIRRAARRFRDKHGWTAPLGELSDDKAGDRQEEFDRRMEYDEKVRPCIERLEAAERAVVELHYLVGLEYADVGIRLGISTENARQRSQRGRKKLRECLKASGWE